MAYDVPALRRRRQRRRHDRPRPARKPATRSPTSCSTTCWPRSTAARDDDAVRCVVLTSTHEKVFSAGGDLGRLRRRAPLVHKHFAHRPLPAPVPGDRRARQADAVRGQRPRARRRARARAGLRPDRRQGERALRHAGDQRRRLPVHDHGADLPQRRRARRPTSCCCWASRSAPPRPSGSGSSTGSCRGRRVRRRGRRLGGPARRQVAAADAPGQGRDVPPAGHGARRRARVPARPAVRSRSRPTTSRRACKAFFEKREPVWTGQLSVTALRCRTSDRTPGGARGAEALGARAGPATRGWSARPASRAIADWSTTTCATRTAACWRPAARSTDMLDRRRLPGADQLGLLDLHDDVPGGRPPRAGRARAVAGRARGLQHARHDAERLPRRHVPGRRVRALGRRLRARARARARARCAACATSTRASACWSRRPASVTRAVGGRRAAARRARLRAPRPRRARPRRPALAVRRSPRGLSDTGLRTLLARSPASATSSASRSPRSKRPRTRASCASRTELVGVDRAGAAAMTDGVGDPGAGSPRWPRAACWTRRRRRRSTASRGSSPRCCTSRSRCSRSSPRAPGVQERGRRRRAARDAAVALVLPPRRRVRRAAGGRRRAHRTRRCATTRRSRSYGIVAYLGRAADDLRRRAARRAVRDRPRAARVDRAATTACSRTSRARRWPRSSCAAPTARSPRRRPSCTSRPRTTR